MTSGTPLNLTLTKREVKAEPEKPTLTPDQVRILSYIEQKYYETGLIATEGATANAVGLPVEAVKRCWKNELFRKVMFSRGIDLSRQDDLEILTPVQLTLANLLLNIHDKTSVRQKLEVVKVSSQQYHAWMRNPAFQQYLRKRAEETFKAADSDAYLGLTKAIQGGDVKAIQLFFEMRGIYNPKMQFDVNIEVVLTKVIEIVSRHVTDDRVLTAIASDFEQLGTGVK